MQQLKHLKLNPQIPGPWHEEMLGKVGLQRIRCEDPFRVCGHRDLLNEGASASDIGVLLPLV